MSEYMNNINPETNNNSNAEQTIVDTTATETGASFEGNGMNSRGNPYVKEGSGSRRPRNLKSGAMVAVAVCVAAALTITGVATNGFGLAKTTAATTASTSSSTSASSSDSKSDSGTNTVKAADASATAVSETSSLDTSDMFTDRDLEQTYDESEAETITLADGESSTSADGVTIDGDTITITKEGIYVLSGTLSDGQVIVDCEDENAKVQLVLNGVTISNDSSAAIYVKAADKTFITTVKGTTNTLSMTGTYEAIDENNIDAVIFAKDDLTLNGEGTLNVTASTGHGIVCKDDLKVTGGTYNITSPDHALNGKDSVRIADGSINLKTTEDGGDGIHSGNDEDSTKGWIYISGGNITIAATDDGIHSDTEVRIDSGTIDVSESYEGIEGEVINVVDGTINVVSSDDGFNAAGSSTTEASDGRTSQTSTDIEDSTGAVTMMSTDASATDAMSSATVRNDNSGDSSFSDDNASDSARAGGPGNGGFGGGPGNGGMGGGMMDTDENAGMYFYGGTTTVDAGGDGLDSNGYLVVNGGTIYVSGPTSSRDGALDFGISGTINGGTVIAVGAAGMDETFGSDSTQGVIRIQTNSTVTGEVQLLDSDGNVLASYTPTKQYSSVVISTAGITDGSTYTVKTGSESTSVTMDGLIYGESSGMGGFGGGMQGGPGNGDFGGKGQRPDMNSSDGSSSDGSGRMAPPDMGSSDSSGSSDGNQRGPRGGRPGSESDSSSSSDSDGSL